MKNIKFLLLLLLYFELTQHYFCQKTEMKRCLSNGVCKPEIDYSTAEERQMRTNQLVEERLQRLETTKEKQKQKIWELELYISKQNDALIKVQKQLFQQSEEMKTMKTENTKQASIISEEVRKMIKWMKKIDAEQAESITRIDGDINDVKKKISDLTHSLGFMQQSLGKQTKEIKNLKTDIELKLQTEITRVSKAAAALDKKVMKIKNSLTTQDATLKSLSEQQLKQFDITRSNKNALIHLKNELDTVTKTVGSEIMPKIRNQEVIVKNLVKDDQELKSKIDNMSKLYKKINETLVQLQIISRKVCSKQHFSGPELTQMMEIGTRVVPGVDWHWGNQNGFPPGEGTCITEINKQGWVDVKWDNGGHRSYRMGHDGKYDLKLVECH